MASINTAVTVNVDRNTSAVTVAGYSLAMFLGKHRGFTSRYKVYADIAEVGADFATTSDEYKAAQATFSQEPAVDAFAIGRQDTTIVTYTPVVANSTTYSVTLNGTLFSFISDASATAAEIVTGLIAAINGGSEPVTASGTTTLILTADVGGVPFSVKATTNLTPVYTTTESLTDALNAVMLENNDWYGLTAYTHTKADQLEIAAFAQSARKFYKTSDEDTNIINQSESADTTSAAKAFKTNGYDRAGFIYGGNADTQFPEAAYLGVMFGYEAGSATMEFKKLSGVTVDNLTATQITNAKAKNTAVFIPRGGQNTIHSPTMGDGSFDDLIRDLDFAASDIQVSVYSALINSPKIPFTERGFAILEGAIRTSVLRSMNLGIFSDDVGRSPVITMPKVTDISANDRALRKVTGIKVSAYMAGAIHEVVINLNAGI
jgi:hypothetical protein